jgi:hypothetical protein
LKNFLHTEVGDNAAQPRPADPFKALRARQRTVSLDSFAFAWMAHLPREVRPLELGRLYPRIVNDLTQLWTNGSQIDDYLDQLLLDKRASRNGFPKAVRDELLVLRSHNMAKYTANSHGGWENEPFSK